uniref:Contactin associated protein like 3 n=1 Tax=Poecilia mexicana TaxID=48701 RepID=A0A3B3WQR7_9TELE
ANMLTSHILIFTRTYFMSSCADKPNKSHVSCYFLPLSAGAGGWSPLSSDRYQWLEVDLGERTKITAVATQGRYGSSDWLTSYQLMFSDTGHNWKQYRQEDSIGSFPGNSNADSVVQYKLQQPAVARFLRLIPLDWNPAGRIGLRLEAYGCPYTSDVMSFDGGSSLTYRPGPVPRQGSKQVISLKFKTLRNSGTLLHAEGREGSVLSLQLERGKLQLLLRQGKTLNISTSSSSEPRRLTSVGSLLDDQHWHLVVLRQRNSQLNLTVDRHTETVQTDEEFSLWDGNVTFSCAEPVHVAVTFPGPHSFLRLPWTMPSASSGMSVGFQFRTWNEAGLLLTFDLPRQGGEVWLYLAEARLRLRIQRGGSGLNDGQWHSVDLTSRHGRLTVSVDKQETGVAHASPSFPVLVSNQIFFGGCPAEDYNQECKKPHGTFQGCMRLLALDNQPVDLIMVQQRLLGNYSQLQIDMCGIIDRCSPSHCEHGGLCSQTWTVFHCNCSDSGYSGATCHSSAYEQSCEAYKHSGNTSGYFYIDVDGSGPIKPQLVYCNMTDENTWMVLQHNNTELTKVRPSPGEIQHLVQFDYMSEEEQLAAIIHQSEHCQQELSYQCRKSRLLNTQEGSPFSWWLGGPGTGLVQTYWGGAQPGSQQCACGLQGDCVDPQLYCNCDADRMEWSADAGFISHKESLPVRSLVLGDVQRPGSEAAYRVGSLQCHGDKNFWNAAFFDQETSYLHFPTFHGELSADVSFFFKTTASFGVFLENLGIKDFIRIELSSSTQVVFSFDVGNGPLEVSVESSYPLNDDRWHRVRAERNVKEASLRLDDLPVATQEAPADGHIHLQLNSQLFIGGTASRQRGFRGCIRALQLNGVTLDLEERAEMTPGVRPGCPGHCSSYGSLCQNQGRCVERATGFHCDCSLSAYTGVFCQTEVSADFKSGTSISYAFKELDELSRNGSDLPSSIYSDPLPRGENVSLSFRTTQSPALLLHVGSHFNQYLALLINRHGTGQEIIPAEGRIIVLFIFHQIDGNAREDFNLSFAGELGSLRSLVLGRVPDSDSLDPDLARLSALGFAGCLSVVRYNSISPLKAALLHPDTSPVVVLGPLVRSNCGSSASANPYSAENTHHLSGKVDFSCVIAVAIFVIVTVFAITARFLYRRKETYRSREVKAAKQEESQDFHYNNQTEGRKNASGENAKEFFM